MRSQSPFVQSGRLKIPLKAVDTPDLRLHAALIRGFPGLRRQRIFTCCEGGGELTGPFRALGSAVRPGNDIVPRREGITQGDARTMTAWPEGVSACVTNPHSTIGGALSAEIARQQLKLARAVTGVAALLVRAYWPLSSTEPRVVDER